MDTGAFVAIADDQDGHHDQAVACLHEVAAERLPVLVSGPTVYETHRRLFDVGLPRARQFLDSVLDGSMTLVDAIPDDVLQGLGIIDRFVDRAISLTDAVNMAIMLRLGIGQVFSFDDDFLMVGFLRAPPLQVARQ